jgi:predicted nuclease with TOPRIM domain
MSPGEWIALGALGVSTAALSLAQFARPAFVPSSRLTDLRRTVDEMQATLVGLRVQNEECRRKNEEMAGQIASLESQLDLLRGEARWWQDEWRALRTRVDKSGA